MGLRKKVWYYIIAGSKKDKKIKRKEILKGKSIAQGGDPEQYYSENQAWTLANAGQEMWALSQEHMGERICTEISLRVKYIPIEKTK